MALLEADLQALPCFLFFYCQEKFLPLLVLVGEGISIYKPHAVNTICTSLS